VNNGRCLAGRHLDGRLRRDGGLDAVTNRQQHRQHPDQQGCASVAECDVEGTPPGPWRIVFTITDRHVGAENVALRWAGPTAGTDYTKRDGVANFATAKNRQVHVPIRRIHG
jgi:hypothetical protein